MNSNKVDILAFGAHPDDVELGAGGTLAKLISEGKSVAVVDLTQGELGTRGSVEERAAESAAASEILGIKYRENLGLPDGFLENTRSYQEKIIRMVRKYQPTIVFSNAINDRHPDHAKGCKLVSDSCFLSGLPKVETILNGENQTAWRPSYIFNYIQWKEIEPDFVIDVSDFMEQKVKSCLAYKSQFYDPKSDQPMTPIATKDFLESITYRAQNLGRLSGVTYAEGFTSEKMIALKNFDGIVL